MEQEDTLPIPETLIINEQDICSTTIIQNNKPKVKSQQAKVKAQPPPKFEETCAHCSKLFKNSKLYNKHIYYITKMKDVHNKPFFDRENKHQMEEIKNIGFFC